MKEMWINKVENSVAFLSHSYLKAAQFFMIIIEWILNLYHETIYAKKVTFI